jgi:hypothetical protein
MMAALTLSQDDFLALGRQLADAAISAYGQARAAHATTVNLPAPTAHPLIETIVNQYGGQYAVAPPTTPDQAATVADRVAALQAALVTKGVIQTADVTAAAATLAAQPAPTAPAT